MRKWGLPLMGAMLLTALWTEKPILFGADDTVYRAVTGEPVQAAAAAPDLPKELTASDPNTMRRTDEYYEIASPKSDNLYFRSDSFAVQPCGLYRYKMNACWFGGGGGCFPAGLTGVTNDYVPPVTETPDTPCSRIIRILDGVQETCFTVGRWESTRTLRFTPPELIPVCPIYTGIPSIANRVNELSVTQDGKRLDGITVSDGIHTAVSENGTVRLGSKIEGLFLPIGSGEQINGSKYHFNIFAHPENGNFDRFLDFSNASFNSCRWCFGDGSEVIYKFQLQPVQIGGEETQQPEPIQFTDAKVRVNVPYWQGGRCVVEMSLDRQNWKTVGTLEKAGSVFGAPDDFFVQPVNTLYVRCRGEKTETGANFQIYNLELTAALDNGDYNGKGTTYFADVTDSGSDAGYSVCPLFLNDGYLYSAVTNKTDQPLSWDGSGTIRLSVDGEDAAVSGEPAQLLGAAGAIPANGRAIAVQNIPAQKKGKKAVVTCAFDRTFTFEKKIISYFIQDYTAQAADVSGHCAGVNLSWCEADRKVPRHPASVSYKEAQPVKIAAPRNDFEAFQIIVRPEWKLTGLTAAVTDLAGPDGAVIGASNIQLRYGYYHKVEVPTDGTCVPGWYVDALVPMNAGADGKGKPLCVKANENQPVFVTVYVPFGTKAGDYSGILTLSDARGEFQASVPFTLTVWDFDQPAKNRFETAYGFSPGNIWTYQNAQSEEEKRAVWEKYLKDASDHRISFYNPVPMDGFGVTFDKEKLTAQFNFDRFDAEMQRVMDKYNVTNFQLPVQGLGGGTYEGRWIGDLAGFKSGTPEYQTLMTDYLGKLQAHLAEKGWLDKCYCYWFDEPSEKDYEFVAEGFGKLKKYGPGIGRMLTEQPGDGLCGALDAAGGDVTIWCPISDAFSIEEAQKRKAQGERFWWYVCTGPKAPYCTEFTDHPGHELRLWHWQAFERGIVGSLIWQTNYWHSPEAFPNSYQDPYLDPMCYVTSYNLTPGTKSYWGNGDGRFFYPPLCASVPGRNGGKAVLDDPVDSIRWEELREGIEDYEMLLTLKERFEAKKAGLSGEQCGEIEKLFDFSDLSTSMTTFTDDPGLIIKHRARIAEAIEQLGE